MERPIPLQTLFLPKKKKKKNSKMRRCQSYTGTRIKEDKGWKMSPRL